MWKFLRKDYLKHKETARFIVYEKLNHYSEILGVQYQRISIRNQKTRWGSCSKRGNLNFNYRIVFLPNELQDYIIVHELCHLIEFNHSKNFWALVEKILPNYRDLQLQLRNHTI